MGIRQWLLCAGVLLASGASLAGDLHADDFGNVYDGDSPFSIGRIHQPVSAGRLRSDDFGNVYAGDSPFAIGKIQGSGVSQGYLHRDDFGNVYAGDNPFRVDVSGFIQPR
mgnify:CR=1 FL=1